MLYNQCYEFENLFYLKYLFLYNEVTYDHVSEQK